jgi:hypothetical protein
MILTKSYSLDRERSLARTEFFVARILGNTGEQEKVILEQC